MKTEPDLLVQIQDQPALTSRLKSYGLQRPVLFGSCLLPHHLLLSPWLSELQLCCHVSSSNKKRFFQLRATVSAVAPACEVLHTQVTFVVIQVSV